MKISHGACTVRSEADVSVLEQQFRVHQYQVHVAACVRFVWTVPQAGGPPLQTGPLTCRGKGTRTGSLGSSFSILSEEWQDSRGIGSLQACAEAH